MWIALASCLAGVEVLIGFASSSAGDRGRFDLGRVIGPGWCLPCHRCAGMAAGRYCPSGSPAPEMQDRSARAKSAARVT
jgi:hypothetical protein